MALYCTENMFPVVTLALFYLQVDERFRVSMGGVPFRGSADRGGGKGAVWDRAAPEGEVPGPFQASLPQPGTPHLLHAGVHSCPSPEDNLSVSTSVSCALLLAENFRLALLQS